MGLQQTVCTVVNIKCIYLDSKPKVTPKGEITGTEFFFQSDQYIPTMGITLNCADILKQMSYEKRSNYTPNIKFTISSADLKDPTEQIEELLELDEDTQCVLTLGIQTEMIPQSEKSRGVAYAKMAYISIKTASSSNVKTNSTNSSTSKTSTSTVGYSSTATA
ncbi:MAG: hypothetical protein O4805_04605 [Trichodesmium sp. St16_bin2-tuft]|nr:hypothetical protein [Trichodesmium sp. St16_bin2-tuft]